MFAAVITLLVSSSSNREVNGFRSSLMRPPVVRASNVISMAVSDKPDLEKVTNAFDSPSIRKLQKDPTEFMNPFDSPSCKLNGVDTDREFPFSPCHCYIHTYIHAYIHTYIYTYMHNIHSYISHQ